MAFRLVDAYDAVFFDLDGVIYLGPTAIPGVAEAISQLSELDVPLMYVTNNAAPSAQDVVSLLNGLGLPAVLDEVLTSAQVAAEYLPRELEPGSKVLIVGSEYLAQVIELAGLVPVFSADDEPVAVIQGYNPKLNWSMLDEATLAIERGATWYACNDDSSRPSERGTVPGVGGGIALISTAIGGAPKTFGKPFTPMMEEAVRRTGAKRPIFVGDRVDTDIAGANAAGIDSLLVFTGVHGKADLVSAKENARPTAIGGCIGALLEPPRTLTLSTGGAKCGKQLAAVRDKALVIETRPEAQAEQLDALWALANLSWSRPGSTTTKALRALTELK
ncbi:MAG: HAD-IIA family hydrolase [Propionibacteriaceae bacterium]|jgi:HAD superfamily hydrolase (TIGR01450 family)|nr:HAD-IIA family hydrolase [Propionibacteriaceae bacterium]